MKIVLTSFRDARNWKGTSCSIAKYPPKNSDMPDFLVDVKPVYKGQNLSPYMNPENFRLKYEWILEQQRVKLIDLLCRIDDETLVLCCWCNIESQFKKFPQFGYKLFCHRILLGYWVERNFPYTIVKYSDGAENPIWKRNN